MTARSVFITLLAVFMCPAATVHGQEMMPPAASSWSTFAPRPDLAPGTDAWQGPSGYVLNVYGNNVQHVYGGWTTRISGVTGGNHYRFRARALPTDIALPREAVTIVLRWRGSFGDEVRPDYVWDYRVQTDGSITFDRVVQAPVGTNAVDVELLLQWAPSGRVSFDALSFMPVAAPAARPVRLAAIYYRPSGSTNGFDSVQKAATFAEQVAAAHSPDVMVLGELLNVIGAPGTYGSKAETIPGPSTDRMASVARTYGVNIAFGMLERDGTFLYNTAVLLDRSGGIVGKHRKVQLPRDEVTAGLSPGNGVPVFDLDVGRVAMLICQDTSFPEPAREAALQGAELLLVPIWGGKSAIVRARAVEHSMYLVASGYDYASEVVGPLGNVLDVAGTTGPDVAIANVDLRQRFREIWLGDWRDISNQERRTAPYTHPNGASPPPPPADTTPPTVAITTPASGATVSGTVNITANASDNVGVTKVRFLIDAAPLGADDTAAPYATSWNSTTLADGSHTITAMAFDAANNTSSSSVTVNVVNTAPPPSARPIPGTIQAEDYDAGVEGVTYHDTTAGNSGGQYRSDGVDIEVTRDASGGYNVGWIAPLEWLKYTVSVSAAGTYAFTARVAANGAGGTFHVEVAGANVTGPLTIPNTGGWQTWTNVSANVTLAAGVQPMRIVFDAAGPTGVVGNLNYVRFDSVTTPPPPPEVVLYAADFARSGAWVLQSDATAAAGQKALTADNGAAATSAPAANPTSYIEASFTAPAGTSYTLWLRLRATADSKFNESVWVQFSDARAGGSAVYATGTTNGLLVNLENCANCGVSGWGWQNRAYWLTQPATVTFATSGTHVIRIQAREDGAQIDQVVLSPSRYLTTAPGPVKNDNTIVAK